MQAETFGAVAREWFAKQVRTWAESHAEITKARLEKDLYPYLGSRPIAEVTAPEVLTVLRRIESRGANESARRVRVIAGMAFRYAVATGRAERDPTADLRGALAPAKHKHHAAVTEPKAVGELLRAIEGHQGQPVVHAALKLAPLTFVRPGELRHAEWSEIDSEAATWTIPAEKMKRDTSHIVPLSRQALEVLTELAPLTGRGRYVFPSLRACAQPMSENTVNAALRRLGYGKDDMTGHGFRAMARTLLDEALGFAPHLIEHQLAHAVRDPLGRAYNRTSHLPERRRMMQAWADYLDALRDGANVVPLHTQGQAL